ncbi:uncharacterized protein LACBIDRAFT_334115 [Laccaria bicolor S238N-H82]|uniref:Predicted protein n=1 Tax=Laccaria bicolor (strain S238N-H82 / ATCC MYA-4686) TaxID=486041 RepID=B0DY47_LACBS|nr:uncharacterized protein LACBIDRAFT_334115 [Laccaria bicolor S238N-H82]EDR00456.1 predicted protein [Laccaria bicolor S238N-H82]|eukprot:XP_001888848.1 predicted protein [Laccaria bicolor S238N-H82]
MFLRSCIQCDPLHPDVAIRRDSVWPSYEFPWWTTPKSYPKEGIYYMLSKSAKWAEDGALPLVRTNLQTSSLSPKDGSWLKAQLEQAQELIVERIEHAKAEVDFMMQQIRDWEDIVFLSSKLDAEKLWYCMSQLFYCLPLSWHDAKPLPNIFMPEVSQTGMFTDNGTNTMWCTPHSQSHAGSFILLAVLGELVKDHKS